MLLAEEECLLSASVVATAVLYALFESAPTARIAHHHGTDLLSDILGSYECAESERPQNETKGQEKEQNVPLALSPIRRTLPWPA